LENGNEKSIIFYLREHWAFAVSLFYLYISLIGMTQAYFFFKHFGINIFEFSEVSDFALAAFRQPSTLFIALRTAAGFIFFAFVIQMLASKFMHFQSNKTKLLNRSVFMLIPVLFIIPFLVPPSSNYSHETFKNDYVSNPEKLVQVTLRTNTVHNVPKESFRGYQCSVIPASFLSSTLQT